MRYADVHDVWTVDVTRLSNADRGKVYLDRARWVVSSALTDPRQRAAAVDGHRFRRSYLVERIGCRPSVTTQNPGVRELLRKTDGMLAREADAVSACMPKRGRRRSGAPSMQAELAGLRLMVDRQSIEIAELRSRLHDAGSAIRNPDDGPSC